MDDTISRDDTTRCDEGESSLDLQNLKGDVNRYARSIELRTRRHSAERTSLKCSY